MKLQKPVYTLANLVAKTLLSTGQFKSLNVCLNYKNANY